MAVSSPQPDTTRPNRRATRAADRPSSRRGWRSGRSTRPTTPTARPTHPARTGIGFRRITGLRNEDLGEKKPGMLAAMYRDYRPGLGRWLRRDPAGFVDGGQVYRYAQSRPLTLIDPSGLIVEVFAGGSWLLNSVESGSEGVGIANNLDFADVTAPRLREALQLAGIKDRVVDRHFADASVTPAWLETKSCPNEPVILVGYSNGARAAHSLARVIPRVDLLLMIDSVSEDDHPTFTSSAEKAGHRREPLPFPASVKRLINIRQENGLPSGRRVAGSVEEFVYTGQNDGTVFHPNIGTLPMVQGRIRREVLVTEELFRLRNAGR